MRALALAASAFLLSAAPSPSQQQQEQRRAPAEIAEAHRRLERAFNRGDATAAAALYTEDAALLPPGADILTGRGGPRRPVDKRPTIPGRGTFRSTRLLRRPSLS